jgi:uncharacterized protein YkwD
MKRTILFVVLLTCTYGFAAKQRHSHSYVRASEKVCWDEARKAFNNTNKFRANKGLPKLEWNQKIAEIARVHSVNMASRRVEFGHDGFAERCKNFPGQVRRAAENVYMCDHKDDLGRRAVDAWIESPGHLHNIVGDYNTCGIGVFQNDKGEWYITQLFARYK